MTSEENRPSIFSALVFKKLSSTETSREASNQHEFNGSRPLRDLFGDKSPQRLNVDFFYLFNDGNFVEERGYLTWYDARANHPTRSEYRLYYFENDITRRARVGDTLLIGRRFDESIFVVIAPGADETNVRIAQIFNIEIEPGSAFVAITSNSENSWESEQDMTTTPSQEQNLNAIRNLQRKIGEIRSSEQPNSFEPEL